jgi:hypothetical protein
MPEVKVKGRVTELALIFLEARIFLVDLAIVVKASLVSRVLQGLKWPR